jgi:hypothetical protein
MTSPDPEMNTQPPNPGVLARTDPGRVAEQAIGEALAGLGGVRELPVSEHVERFEAVHAALTDALSKAENLLSGSSG